jgi:hypothetical protein
VEKLENQGTQERLEEWVHQEKMGAMEIKEVLALPELLDLLDFLDQEDSLD